MKEKIEKALLRIDEAVKKFEIDAIYGLFSGGDDSICSTHLASLYAPQTSVFKGCIHAETRTGPISKMSSDWVKQFCAEQGWHVNSKTPATTYLMMIAEHGFPGPSSHQYMYRYLKERVFAHAKKEEKARLKLKHIAFVTGMRRSESTNRANTPFYEQIKSDYFISPIADWSEQDCLDYIAYMGLERNPVKMNTGISGECKCGSHASPSERAIDFELYPTQREWVKLAEDMVAAAQRFQQFEFDHGMRETVIDDKYLKWGNGRANFDLEHIMPMPGFFACHGCVGRLDQDGNVGDDPDLAMRVADLRRKYVKDELAPDKQPAN